MLSCAWTSLPPPPGRAMYSSQTCASSRATAPYSHPVSRPGLEGTLLCRVRSARPSSGQMCSSTEEGNGERDPEAEDPEQPGPVRLVYAVCDSVLLAHGVLEVQTCEGGETTGRDGLSWNCSGLAPIAGHLFEQTGLACVRLSTTALCRCPPR
eukprot:5766088-Pyramimonas_sp.AAC.1